MAGRLFNTSWKGVDKKGEPGSPESKTETAGYRSITQQLARLARAGATLQAARREGYDIVQGDEEAFLSGVFDDPAYDMASVAEGAVQLRARREAVSAADAEKESAALQQEPEASADGAPEESSGESAAEVQ